MNVTELLIVLLINLLATKRKRRVLSSDDAEKTEEDVPEEFQGEADEDDIDSDSDYEQPSRTGKRPPPARKVRAARPIPPKSELIKVIVYIIDKIMYNKFQSPIMKVEICI